MVPPGEGWASGAFAPEVRGELLYGRGAVDMKGAIACMVAAVADIPAEAGTLSFIITGDEEGPALHGTRALIDHMRSLGEIPDLILVGEPTSVHRLGDMMKIGRRGSVNVFLEVAGTQGHVAYPHLADNPLPAAGGDAGRTRRAGAGRGDRLVPAEQSRNHRDRQPQPGAQCDSRRGATARISIRFNDLHSAGLARRDWSARLPASTAAWRVR